MVSTSMYIHIICACELIIDNNMITDATPFRFPQC